MKRQRRKYTLVKRAASVRETRQGILDAAAECFALKGIRQTSMQEVARTADVSAGTVANHFPRREELVEATLSHIGASLPFPQWEDLADLADPKAKVLGLLRLLHEYFRAGDRWLHIFFTERESTPSVARAVEARKAQIDELVSLALGPAGRDAKLAMAVSSVLHPGFRHILRTNGASEKLALEIESDIVGALLDEAQPRWRQSETQAQSSTAERRRA